jgi:hypothetical protein
MTMMSAMTLLERVGRVYLTISLLEVDEVYHHYV